MKKLVKFTFITIGALLTLLVIAAIALLFVFDPNDYKPQLTQLVKQQTGRQLQIPGKIELSVFPWLGVKLGELELSNAPGFGAQPFAKIDAVDVRVELLPLLKKQVRIGHVELTGLKVDLQRNQQGKTNWDDLIQPAATKPEQVKPSAETGKGLAIESLAVGGISINNAQLNWTDKQHNQFVEVQTLNLESGSIKAEQPVKLKLDTRFKSQAPDINGKIALAVSASFRQQQQLLVLKDLDLTAQLNGAILPGKKLDSRLRSDNISFNQNKQTLKVNNLQLSGYGIQLHADAQVTGIDKQPRYQVSLASDEFSAKSVASQLGISLPQTADTNAMSRIQLSSKMLGDLNNISIKPLAIKLDDSNLTGQLQVKNFAKPALRYQLAIDAIDADRYLPPAKDTDAGKTVAPATAASSEALQLPTELLRSLDVKGDLKIDKLKVSNVHSQKIQITSNAKDGVIRLYPLKASMYQGNYNGDIKVDVRGKTPYLAMNERLSNINIGPLLKDLWGDDKVQGIANLNARLTARGISPDAIRKSLTGNAGFQFSNGMVKGFNIAAYERTLKAKLKGQAAPSEDAPLQTDFSEIKGTVQITNGLARNKDLSAALPHARIIGKGWANLVKETVDYTIYAKFTSKAEGQNSKTYAQMDKTPLPVRFTGKLTKPDISVDYQYVLKIEAKKKLEEKKAAVQKKIDEKKAAAKRQLEEKKTEEAEELKKKLEEKLNGKLKNLFKF